MIKLVETFPNKFPGRPYVIKLQRLELFTICPKNETIDISEIDIHYIPNKLCLEVNSMKDYFLSYAYCKEYLEMIVNKMYQDLYEKINPMHLKIEGRSNNIELSVIVDSDFVNAMNEINSKVNYEVDNKPMATEEYIDYLINGKG